MDNNDTLLYWMKKWDPISGQIFRETKTYAPLPAFRTVSRTADISGTFIPNTYKVTPFSARTRAVVPSQGPISVSWFTDYSPTYRISYTLEGHWSMLAGGYTPWEQVTSSTCVGLQKEALLRAFSNVGDLSQLELGTELGELRETWEMLWDTILKLLKFRASWKALREFNQSDKSYTVEALYKAMSTHDRYMEIRYGWMPLMRSLIDLVEVFKEGLERLDAGTRINTARGKAKSVKTLTNTQRVGSAGIYLDAKFRNVTVIQVKSCVHYRVKNAPTIQDLLGLSPKFIPETIWELTRCSFIWDWFFLLGPWLQAVRTAISGDFEILGNTTTTVITSTGTIVSKFDGIASEHHPQDLIANINGKEVQRICNQSVPLPGIRYSDVLDIWKHLDLLIIGSKYLPKKVRTAIRRAYLGGVTKYRKYLTE